MESSRRANLVDELISYIVLSAGVALVFHFELAASPVGIGLTIA